jgi:hypothetical protein|eukprot:COSAG06_NODE_1627_length_8882_cov_9.423659_3_plen_140_part_00
MLSVTPSCTGQDGNSFSGQREEPVPVSSSPSAAATAGVVKADHTSANRSNATSSGRRRVEELHFRGTAIVDAVLRRLQADHGLAQAEEVLLTGCSAGGLAAFLQADRIGDFLEANSQPTVRYKVAPVSGALSTVTQPHP